ncbi:hypothetical protein WDU94_012293 [Cyamophila willieti]
MSQIPGPSASTRYFYRSSNRDERYWRPRYTYSSSSSSSSTPTKPDRDRDSDVNVDVENDVAETVPTASSMRVNTRRGVRLGRGRASVPEQSPSSSQARNAGIMSQTSENSLHSQTRNATDSVSNPRSKRIKWNQEMNEYVMRCFFLVNHNQDKNVYGWRKKLLTEFLKKYPNMNVNEGNLADRKYQILKKGYVTEQTIEKIKREVGHILHTMENYQKDQNINTERNEMNANNESNNIQDNIEHSVNQVIHPDNRPQDNYVDHLKPMFEENLITYSNSVPEYRPRIPNLPRRLNRKHFQYINAANELISREMSEKQDKTLPYLLLVVFCAAVTVVQKCGLRISDGNEGRRNETSNEYEPRWKQSISNRIKMIRSRISRYHETNKRKEHNKAFTKNEKKFYSNLDNPTMSTNVTSETPDKTQIERYWSSIWSNDVSHDQNATWLNKIRENADTISPMNEVRITLDDIQSNIKKSINWKAPGIDGIQNFWWKYFPATHVFLMQFFNNYLENPENIPEIFTKGKTVLIYKKNNPLDAQNYRPITCLLTVYKLFTSIIKNKVYEHVIENNILAWEQKGCTTKSYGSKEQIVIDSFIMNQARIKNRNLSTCYVDYAKAYDSVPHTWLLEVLRIYKVNNNVITTLQKLMTNWKTKIHLNDIVTDDITFKRGLYQGDSYSSLWFCLAINPLSTILNTLNTGYKMEGMKITHLLFMDDLKLFASSVVNLKKMISVVHDFSEDIQMKFGLDKCKILNMIRGKHSTDPDEIVSPKIEQMNETEVYRYLGINQNVKIDHTKLKNEFKETYSMRLEKVLKTKLNSTNLIKAINSWAIASLSYTYGILKWSQTDLETLDRLTRTTMTKHRVHHPRACVERLYVPRRNGGRGLLNIQKLHNAQVIKMKNYFNNSDNPMHEILKNNNFDYLALKQDHEERFSNNNEYVNQAVDTWKKKTLHGKYPQLLDEPKIHKENSITYLRKGELYPETEGFITAIQDSVIATKNHQKFIFKTITDDKCRLCKEKSETIEHVIGSCKILANTEYLNRHNQVAKIIYSKLIIQNKIKDYVEPYYKLNPEPVLENDQFKILWDRQIITDKNP